METAKSHVFNELVRRGQIAFVPYAATMGDNVPVTFADFDPKQREALLERLSEGDDHCKERIEKFSRVYNSSDRPSFTGPVEAIELWAVLQVIRAEDGLSRIDQKKDAAWKELEDRLVRDYDLVVSAYSDEGRKGLLKQLYSGDETFLPISNYLYFGRSKVRPFVDYIKACYEREDYRAISQMLTAVKAIGHINNPPENYFDRGMFGLHALIEAKCAEFQTSFGDTQFFEHEENYANRIMRETEWVMANTSFSPEVVARKGMVLRTTFGNNIAQLHSDPLRNTDAIGKHYGECVVSAALTPWENAEEEYRMTLLEEFCHAVDPFKQWQDYALARNIKLPPDHPYAYQALFGEGFRAHKNPTGGMFGRVRERLNAIIAIDLDRHRGHWHEGVEALAQAEAGFSLEAIASLKSLSNTFVPRGYIKLLSKKEEGYAPGPAATLALILMAEQLYAVAAYAQKDIRSQVSEWIAKNMKLVERLQMHPELMAYVAPELVDYHRHCFKPYILDALEQEGPIQWRDLSVVVQELGLRDVPAHGKTCAVVK